MGWLVEHEAEGVLCLADALAQVGKRSHGLSVGGTALLDCGTVDGTELVHGLHRLKVALEHVGGLFRNLQLAVEHQQGIVCIGHVGYELRLHGLLLVLRLPQCDLGVALGVEQLAEEVYLPAGINRKRVSLACLVAVPAGNGALGRERKLGGIGKARREESSASLVYAEHSTAQVGVVGQGLFDERLQLRVGKHLAPRQVAEIGRIRSQGVVHHRRVPVEALGHDVFGSIVCFVDVATAQQGSGTHQG